MLFVFALALAVQGPSESVEQQLLQEAGEVQLVYPLNKKVEVSPGQQFYGEFSEVTKQSVTYRLSAPFKSSMGGTMGLPFSFAIDERELVPSYSSDGWTYYVPKGKRFRAWHGLLGNVLAEGDTVGLRVNRDGRREWFVDNSKHNGTRTVWTRKIKDKDPAVTEVPVSSRTPTGPIHKLIYLGVSSEQVRVRHEQIYPDGSITRDDFEFPVSADGSALGSVMGATFKIEPRPLGATVEVFSAMTGEGGSVRRSEVTTR